MNQNKCIHILSQFPKISLTLSEQYITRFGYDVCFHTEYHSDFMETEILLIIEPFKIDKKYFTVSKLWKNFLAIDYPSKILLIAGFSNYKNSNYMDLLKLPKNFPEFIKTSKQTDASWEIPIDGLDLLHRFKLFFKGHGPLSLLAKLNQIYFSLNTAYISILSKESSVTKVLDTLIKPYLIPEWKDLIHRWDRYTIFFKYTPFFTEMKAVDDVFKHISDILQSDGLNKTNFLSLQLDSKVKDVHRILKEIDRKYIRPEIYNEA